MSFSIGIVGFPNVGKSTLFQAITKKQVDCSNYAFCTIDPNIGVVSVRDDRVDQIAEALSIKKKIYPSIEFIDIAGLIEGASEGKGLGNKFLSCIREAKMILFVLRAFQDDHVIGAEEVSNAFRESELLEKELILKDLETIDKRITSLDREVKAQKKEAVLEMEALKKGVALLEKDRLLIEADFSENEKKVIANNCFLTYKPIIYLLNGKENEILEKTKEEFRMKNRSFLIMNMKEADSLKIDNLIKECYRLLDLITFFTVVGKEEVRAWKIKKETKAPQAGGTVHSDFEEKFIKAIVVSWDELIRKNGEGLKKRVEGKDYAVQDGDVIEIKHS